MFTKAMRSMLVVLALSAFCVPAMAENSTHSSQPGQSGGASSGHEEEGNINPIPMSWEQIKGDLTIWTAAVFVVLVVILGKFAWKPLADGLDKREKHIADQIAQANEANQKAKDMLAGYEKKLTDAQDEVRSIIEKGRHDAEQVGREMLDKAKADAKAEQERMLKQIDAATSAAIKELADRSANMAVNLAGRIVKAKLNPKDHAKLIEQAVAGFADHNKN